MRLTKSAFGIPEPEGNTAERLSPHSSALVIMPGAVFSVKKDRIGYGGGYYDRFLAGRDGCKTIAVCYDFQIKDDIPADKHDISRMP